jgi:hypothetical protein
MKALFHVLNFNYIENIKCITVDVAVLNFCNRTGIDCTFIEKVSDFSRKGLFKHKAYIFQISKKWRNEKIAFFFMAFDMFGLKLMHLLKKYNTVYFENIDNTWPKANFLNDFSKEGYHKIISSKIIYSLVLKQDFDVFKISDSRFFLGIDPLKLNQRFVHLVSVYSESILSNNIKIVSKAYNIPNFDIIIIDEAFRMVGQFDEPALESILKVWKDKGISIGVKMRDTQPLSNKVFERFTSITGEIPAEFILHNTRLVIANHTNAINFLSAKIPCVSLMYLNKKYDEQLIENILKRNLRDPSKIRFPYTIDDLEKIVSKELSV